MKVIVEQLVEWRFAGETEVLGENLPRRHFVHHKSHMTRPGLKPRAATVGCQRLTAWAMARPQVYMLCLRFILHPVEKWILICRFNPFFLVYNVAFQILGTRVKVYNNSDLPTSSVHWERRCSVPLMSNNVTYNCYVRMYFPRGPSPFSYAADEAELWAQ
jgi:hypothetical protein